MISNVRSAIDPLPDQLIQPRLDERSVALFVDVQPVGRSGHAPSSSTRNGTVSRPRSQHEVDVASMEAERDPSAGLVEDARPPLDGPVTGERPGVQPQLLRQE